MTHCPQRLLSECLNQIASHFAADHSKKKIELCKELIHFLVETPAVFDEPWTPQLSWTRPLYRGLFDILQSKASQDMLSSALEMTSILLRGFNGYNWSTDSDKISSKFIGLVSRLACVELSLSLDESEKLEPNIVGVCLTIIEHTIITLVNEDLVTNIDPKMSPEEVCSLIDMLRATVIKTMDLIVDSKDENPRRFSELSEEVRALNLGFIRIICLLLTEDSTIPPENVSKLVFVFADALTMKSCYGLHHIIFTALNSYSDHDEILEAIEIEREVFLHAIEECQECQAESSLCYSFKNLLRK